MSFSENISPSRRFTDDDRVTVGVRIMYDEAQAQKHGLLPARWEPVGPKALVKVHTLCDILGCRPAQKRLTISAMVPGAVETIHLNRAYNNVSTACLYDLTRSNAYDTISRSSLMLRRR